MSKLQVDTIVDKEDKSAPTFSKGAIISGVTTASGGVVGNVTCDVTGTLTGTASGLAGSPDITVGQVTASNVDSTGIVTTTGTVVYKSADSPGSSTEPAKWMNHAGGMQLYASSDSSTQRNIIFCTASNSASERLRIDSSGRVLVGTTTEGAGTYAEAFTVEGSTHCGMTIRSATDGVGSIYFSDGTSGDSEYRGYIEYNHTSDFFKFATAATERLRITGGGGFHFDNGELIERVKITAGKLSDNLNIDLENGMVHHFTTAESTTSTPNIRVNSSTTLNSVMAVGDVITVTLITTANASAYSANITIDGSAVTENWVGGSAPSAGGSSGVDIHAFTIIKTAANTYTVIGNHSKTS